VRRVSAEKRAGGDRTAISEIGGLRRASDAQLLLVAVGVDRAGLAAYARHRAIDVVDAGHLGIRATCGSAA